MSITNIQNETGLSRVPHDYLGFIEFVGSGEKDIYIFGADIAGKAIQKLLVSKNFKVQGFFDNNRNKCDVNLNGTPVLHSEKLDTVDTEAVILIASTYIADIIEQLEAQGFYNWVPIAGIIENNNDVDFRSLIDGDLQHNHSGGKFTKDFVEFAITNMVNSQNKYLDPNLLFIRSVDLILTEKCTLKCKDCANLMQYYEKPVNIERNELFDDLDDLVAVADEVNEVRIIGGEPLVNKSFHEISLKAA